MASPAEHGQGRKQCFFQEWIHRQEQDLSDLLRGITLVDAEENRETHDSLSQLVERTIQHFQDYTDGRKQLARDDVLAFFAPTWCTSLVSSVLWMGGCRPSMFIRLIYALCGLEIESQLTEFLQGLRTGSNLFGELSASQLNRVNNLQRKTIGEEEKVSSKMTSLQENVADQPLAVMAMRTSQIGELNRDAEKALDDHEESMVSLLEESDRLRLSTLKEVIEILTPRQAVDFLVASKKLHLCMHEWGKKRDHRHGRN